MLKKSEKNRVTLRFPQIDPAGIMFYPRYFEIALRRFPVLPFSAPPYTLTTQFIRPNRLGDTLDLSLQHDIYHMQIMKGDLARTIESNLAVISHMQLADNPGRHEPGSGEINYEFLFPFIDKLGYDGWIGCEYVPLSDTVDGLKWIEKHL